MSYALEDRKCFVITLDEKGNIINRLELKTIQEIKNIKAIFGIEEKIYSQDFTHAA